MERKTYFAIENHTIEECYAAIEAAKDHPRATVGQGRGVGKAVVKATGKEVVILLRGSCEGGKFAEATLTHEARPAIEATEDREAIEATPARYSWRPGEDCPIVTGKITDGICPYECAPVDQEYLLTVLAILNNGSVNIDDVLILRRDELEPVQSEGE